LIGHSVARSQVFFLIGHQLLPTLECQNSLEKSQQHKVLWTLSSSVKSRQSHQECRFYIPNEHTRICSVIIIGSFVSTVILLLIVVTIIISCISSNSITVIIFFFFFKQCFFCRIFVLL
jgi:hypothetical protein